MSREDTQNNHRKFKPIFFSWSGDKYDSGLEFLWESIKSGVVNAAEGGLAGVLAEGVLFFSENKQMAEFATEHPTILPIAGAVIGALYGLTKRGIYSGFKRYFRDEQFDFIQNADRIPYDGSDNN